MKKIRVHLLEFLDSNNVFLFMLQRRLTNYSFAKTVQRHTSRIQQKKGNKDIERKIMSYDISMYGIIIILVFSSLCQKKGTKINTSLNKQSIYMYQ